MIRDRSWYLYNGELYNTDNLVGGLDVLPFGDVSVNIGSEDGVAILVPGPEIICDVLEVSKNSNLPPAASDDLDGSVDVLQIGNLSVFLELKDVVNVAVKKPEIPPSSINVIVTASDLFEFSSSPNAQFWPHRDRY